MGEENSLKEPDTINCSKCNTELPAGTKFCTECGTPLTKVDAEEKPKTTESVTCPNCNAELKPESTICTACGKKIYVKTVTNCPKCYAKIKPGTSFCTECGINVHDYRKPKKSADPVDDLKKTGKDLMTDMEKTGKGLMKEVGGFFDKSTSKNSSKKAIKPRRKDQGFLVCDSCGGYYELQKGEEVEDFSEECECGGRLEYKKSLPQE